MSLQQFKIKELRKFAGRNVNGRHNDNIFPGDLVGVRYTTVEPAIGVVIQIDGSDATVLWTGDEPSIKFEMMNTAQRQVFNDIMAEEDAIIIKVLQGMQVPKDML